MGQMEENVIERATGQVVFENQGDGLTEPAARIGNGIQRRKSIRFYSFRVMASCDLGFGELK